jgi:uncharacterized protein (TIGR00251 family)
MTGPVSRLTVKVIPGASSNAIAGWLGDTLRVRVTAPPEKGKANTAVKKLIAAALELPASAVTIVGGATTERKTIEIAGIAPAELHRRLAAS